ncbi:ABC transporter permease [Paraburkholderia pallida]|uniref:ABC transporter permease n=1 Tax=Paraburkholderia pallida TaxID=2547399 RepID=A0A4P7CSH9_9BURK|nr:ABC transporter permease [Paraburkholderia pallida]QBQ98865.1 ABC transporter permease [Paraburkholderia pallida]
MKQWIKPCIGFAAGCAVWQLVVWTGHVPKEYMPGVGTVFEALVGQLRSAEFWQNEPLTLMRTAIGLVAAVALGFGTAVLSARYRLVEDALRPLVNIMRSLPPAAIVPLSIFALGLGLKLFLFIVCFSGVWTVYVSAAAALATSEPVQLRSAQTLGYSGWEIMWQVRIPAAMPAMLTGARLAVADCLIATIAAEMLAGSNGIGFMLYDSAFTMHTTDTFALLVVAGVNGLLFNQAVLRLRASMVRWHDQFTKMVQA